MALADITGGARNHEGIAAALPRLAERFGTRFQTGEAIRAQHAHTTTYIPAQLPDGVVFVEGAEEVKAVVSLCAELKVPVIPFGTGSSLEGQVNAPNGGISIDFSNMKRVLEVNAEDLDCTVEPGITREELNVYLRDTGLFFPIDPGANATLGGMAATRASGTNAVRYGTMATNVLALEVVLPDGRLIRTGTRARKSAAGYDLTHLFVGSEGTLGVITAVTLRLYGIPETISAAVCAFDSLEGAVQTTILAIQIGIPMARIELLDEVQIAAVNQDSGLGLPEAATLFLEFHGSPEGVAEQVRLFGELAEANGGQGFRWATATEERTALWKARHHALFAAKGLRPGCEVFISDVCVPISAMAGAIVEVQRDIRDNGLTAPILGHVGDGNFHVLFLMDPADADEIARIKAVNGRMIDRALAVGGTCTGEHGVGVGKKAYLRKEQGDAVDLMAAIKAAIDPSGIMNPGKIFDPLP